MLHNSPVQVVVSRRLMSSLTHLFLEMAAHELPAHEKPTHVFSKRVTHEQPALILVYKSLLRCE